MNIEVKIFRVLFNIMKQYRNIYIMNKLGLSDVIHRINREEKNHVITNKNGQNSTSLNDF